MVYESDFYTTRRPYSSRPVVSSYSVTTPSRYYTVHDRTATQPRRADEQYSYSYTSESRSSSGTGASGRPSTYTSTSERKSETLPSGHTYNTARSSTTGAGPGGYSYSSSASGPGGYRHYSYRV